MARHVSVFRINKLLLSVVISSALTCLSAQAVDLPASGNLTLQDAVTIAVKNAPNMILASIQVDLAKADEREAGDPFDPVFKASAALDRTRGYVYPQVLQDSVGGTVSTFITDHQDNTELKSSMSKLFRSGVYTDFSVILQSSKNDRLNFDLSKVPLPAGYQYSDYTAAHPGIVQMTINVPLLKFSGENNIAAANENMKRYQREAAEMTLKQEVATIIQNVINNYWGYKASLTRLEYTRDSEAQVARWLGKLEQSSNVRNNNAKGTVNDSSREISHLRGFATQLSADVSKAVEAVNVSRNALAQALGISSDDARKIVQAQDDYPLDWSDVLASFNDAEMRRKWNALAEQNRFDLKAASLQLDAATAISLGAQNDVLPKLDLALILKKQGLSAGDSSGPRLSSLREGRGDLGGTVLLSFEMHLDNSKAKAQVVRTRYLKLQKETEFNNAKRGVGLDVDTVVSSVRNSLVGLAAAKKQTTQYVQALNATVRNDTLELDKVFDLVTIEQARLKAFVDHITAIQNVANSVTAAYYRTGILVRQAGDFQEVSVGDLTKLP